MGASMRAHDWTASPLGVPATWPQSLRLVVNLMLNSKFPMFVAWGPALSFLYNDSYAQILGNKHPRALGQSFHDVCTEIWDDISPLIDGAMRGEATFRENLPLLMIRNGYEEQTWFTFSYSPVRDDDGRIAGMFCACTETTGQVLAEHALRESEARFRNLADQTPVMIWVTDPSGSCTYLNRSWYQFTGQTADQTGGFGWLEATHPEDKAEVEQAFRSAIAAKASFQAEYRLLRADGSYRWMIDAAAPRFAVDGEFLGHVGSVIDIDERREGEERQREAEMRLRTLTNTLPAFVWLATTDGELHYFNDRWYEYTGQNPDQALPSGWVDTLHPDDVARTTKTWADARRHAATYEIEVRYRRRDGMYRWHVVRAEPLRSAEGAVDGWVGTSIDIHDRKLAEERLRRSEAQLRFTAEVEERLRGTIEAPVAMREAAELLGRHLGVSRCAYADVSADHDQFTIRSDYVASGIISTAGTYSLDLFGPRAAASMHGGRTLVVRDVPAELESGEGREMFEAIGIAAIICCPLVKGGRLVAMMAVHQDRPRAWTKDEISLVEAVAERCWAHVERVGAETRLRELNGTLEAQVAERTEALHQAQKMEAMGQLTGGVAHDFNNLLTPIFGSLDMLQRKELGGEREKRLISAAMQAAERAKTLVQRLLAFARRQPLQAIPVNIAKLVSDMGELVASTTGPQIRVTIDTPADLPPAKVDPSQLEMALLNLSVNARDAMTEGGTLRISASAKTIVSPNRPGLMPGNYICLSVADTGTGMDEITRARAIEPFFSTKGIGKGTGLGLSMVHGLALQLGGALTIRSRPGLGTNVELWLPQSDTPPDAVAPPSSKSAAVPVRGTALLVDDEEFVRLSTANMLSDLGYRVIEAASAEGALQVAERGEIFDILITDHLMPGMTGTSLAQQLRTKWPHLPVLVVSGYAEDDGVAADLPRLSKPFRAGELATALVQILNRKDGEARTDDALPGL